MALRLLPLPLLWLRQPPSSRRALASAAVAAVPTAATAKVTGELVATAARTATGAAAAAHSWHRMTRPRRSANPQDLSPVAAARHSLS